MMVGSSCSSIALTLTTFIELSVHFPAVVSDSKSVKTRTTLCRGYIADGDIRWSTPSTRNVSHTLSWTPLSAAFSQLGEPWFPGISRAITDPVWREVACHGFTPANYGTHRWLENDPKAECLAIGRLNLSNAPECVVESLPTSSQARFAELGLTIAKDSSAKRDLSALRHALFLVAAVPSLHSTISQYLRALHVLEPPSADYDVSHSDPDVPFSIFTSVPVADGRRRLRLAESIVHECMHLQLTLIEDAIPLIATPAVQLFSPWRGTLRPIRGVLHGLYVFSVVHEFLRLLSLTGSLTSDEATLARTRRATILDEVAHVRNLQSADGLTASGRSLARHLCICLNLTG